MRFTLLLLVLTSLGILVSCIVPLGGDGGGQSQDRAGLGDTMDILWVIDNSNSMANAQEQTRASMPTLLTGLVDSQVDFQTGVTTTDVSTPGNGNQGNIRSLGPVGGGGSCEAPAILTAQSEDLPDDFNALVDVGVFGSGAETGILAAAYALCKGMDEDFWSTLPDRPDSDPVKVICSQVPPEEQACNDGFFRDGAGLLIVIVSDEGDDAYRNGFLPPPQWLDECEFEHNGDPFFGQCDCRLSWFLSFFNSIKTRLAFATIAPSYQVGSEEVSWCDGSTVTIPGPCNEFGSDVCGIDFYQQMACMTGGLFSPIKSTTVTDDPSSCSLSDFGDIVQQMQALLDL